MIDENNFINNDEISKDISMLEISIRFFHVNENDDLALYMVFDSLLTQKVFLPMNNMGALVGKTYSNSEVIPIFSRPERLEGDTSVKLKESYFKDCIDIIMRAKRNMVINLREIQFVLPYDCIEKMVLPILNQQ